MSTAIRPTKSAEPIPALRNGDRLTREEFERRYEAMPHIKKAELIEGVVYMPSPVSLDGHAEPDHDFSVWLGTYKAHTPGTRSGSNPTVKLELDSEPQPDTVLLINPKNGGNCRIDAKGYIVDAPELVAEMSYTTASIDLNKKFHLYRRAGVREYLVWRVEDQAIDWFILRGSQYEQLGSTADDLLKSECFPGLWLDPAALLRGDMLRVLEVLQRGIGSPDHGAFVAKLEKAER